MLFGDDPILAAALRRRGLVVHVAASAGPPIDELPLFGVRMLGAGPSRPAGAGGIRWHPHPWGLPRRSLPGR